MGSATDCRIAADAAMIDGTGKWVVPGLIDTHVHLSWTNGKGQQIQQTRLAFGITTTRDAGTPGELEGGLARREWTNLPASPEPRLVISAVVSDDATRRDGASDLADLVRVLTARGVDAIKIKDEFSPEALRVIVGVAHSAGRPVFGHTWGPRGSRLMPALEAGVDGFSHLATFSRYAHRSDAATPAPPADFGFWLWTQERWNYVDEDRLQAAIDAVVEHRAWIEPMLVTEKYFTFAYPLPERFAYLGKIRSLEQHLRASLPIGYSGWPARRQWRRRQAVAYAQMCDFVRRFRARGGVIVTGTDDRQPGIDLVTEVGLLAQCGLSPMEALRAATAHAAAALKRSDRGTIERNKLADFLVLEADPLNDPGNLTRVWRVFKGGHPHDPAALLAPTVDAYRDAWRMTWLVRAFGLTLVVAAAALIGGIVLRRYQRP